MNKIWERLADKASIEKTMAALRSNAIESYFEENGAKAKEKLFELLPEGAEVMNMTSVTLDSIGVAQEILESGRYRSVRKQLSSMDRESQGLEMQKLGAAPEWTVGSVHAVTEEGQVMIASATGSQLPAYAYGSLHVIWVVGVQKIVRNVEEGMRRIYEHSYPLEDSRSRRVYGVGSQVGKVLTVNKEAQPGRLSVIFVNEVLGF